MRLSSFLSTVFFTTAAFVSAHNGNGDDHSTITQSAFLACATGEARTKYESCSSSISSKIDQCGDSDLNCACSLANDGFACLTSACPSQTTDLCAASVVLNGLCALSGSPGPSLTSITCPSESDINAFVASLLPSDIASFVPTGVIPSGVAGFIPSGINNLVPSGVPFWNGPAVVNSEGSVVVTGTAGSAVKSVVYSITAPSATGAANGFQSVLGGGYGEDVRLFLVLGICTSVAVAMAAAFL